MRRLLLPTVIVGLLALGACSPAAPVGVEPATSPATNSATSPTPRPTASPSASRDPSASATATATASENTDDESVEEQGEKSGGSMTAFDDPYRYKDGLRVEVTKIRHGTITAADVAAGARSKKGTPWVQLTVRVTNGSKHRLTELVGDYELSFGRNKEPADQIGVPGVRSRGLSGSIAPGKTQITSGTFRVPVKHQDDVVLGFTPDMDHGTTYFAGSIA